MTEILTAETLAALPGIHHAFFTRSYGNGGFYLQENPQDVHVSRARMAACLQVETENLLSCNQQHTPDVVTVRQRWTKETRPQADAMVTDMPGFALGILTADCVPVLFAHEKMRVIGAAHAGWRGAIGDVIENTVMAMEKLGAGRAGIRAALGPCIWQDSYEVGGEFPAPFLAENPDNEKFFHPAFKSGHYHFDLAGYVVEKLRRLGIGSIAASPADTATDPARFYSHRYSTLRNEKRAGNLMSAIAMPINPERTS